MDYDSFELYCWNLNPVPGVLDIIKGSREWVLKENAWVNHLTKSKIVEDEDLGYAELEKITTVEEGISALEKALLLAGGRKQGVTTLNKYSKYVKRITLKMFYLLGGKA